MSGAGSHPVNQGITGQPAVLIDEKAARPKRQAAFCMFAFPLCFHDQKGGGIHGKINDF